MGQRLNIEIIREGNLLANAYYHWSGFTSSAIRLTKLALSEWEESPLQPTCTSLEIFEKALDMLEKTGAKFTNEELNDWNCINKYGKHIKIRSCEGVNRNDGLIAMTSIGMYETRAWEEARIQIDIGTKEINFDVFFDLSDEDLVDGETDKNSLTELNIDFSKIPFNDFDNISSQIINMIDNEEYCFKQNGKYFAFIA